MLSVMINTKDLTEYDLIENAMTFTVNSLQMRMTENPCLYLFRPPASPRTQRH